MKKQGQEFLKYAVKEHSIGSQHVEKFMQLQAHMGVQNMTRSVIEERQTNFREIDVFSRLMADRILFLGTGVNDQVANILVAQLLFLDSVDSKKDIMLYINSPGGSVYAGMGIYDTMQYVSPDVATICTGLAASMGAVLLSGGAKGKRSALPHSRIMIHQPLGGVQGQETEIAITAREILKLKKELYTVLANNTGKTYDDIKRHCDRDYWMRSDEAKTYGIIDEVLMRDNTPPLPNWKAIKDDDDPEVAA